MRSYSTSEHLIVEGELPMMSGDAVATLGPGDFAALDRGNTHTFWNAG